MGSLLPLVDLIPPKRMDAPDAPMCGKCGLWSDCQRPRMPPQGKGKRGVLIVGEGPGANEDKGGRPYINKSGDYFRDLLREISVDLDEDCWTTNAISCRVAKDSAPTERQVYYCRPLVQRAINEYKPNVILLLGARAFSSVIGLAWGKAGLKGKDAKIGRADRWLGYTIPSQVPNVWLVPTYHPNYIMRLREEAKGGPPMEAFYWKKHLQECFSITKKPWSQLPDYHSRCKTVMDEREASKLISAMIGNAPVSFDYETDRLKPDHPKASIICCSVCDGKESIAFPWTRMTREAMGKLLTSATPKWGWNLSFELGWTIREFGHGITNCQLDGMLMAHVLDNRPGTKSLKFQAFARLGQQAYDDEVKPYLQADTGNTENKIRELTRSSGGWRRLGLYNALDSFLEWELCNLMQEELV